MMTDDERRRLLVIEEHLIAEAPELVELSDRLARPPRTGRGRRVLAWLAVVVLVLAVVFEDGTMLLGALMLTAVAVLGWLVKRIDPDK